MSRNSKKVHQITRLAILVAIVFLLAFTPLGYLRVGPIAATTVQMPVIVGAVLMGPVSGAVLGFFFGMTAVISVLLMPGADAFATLAMTHAPASYLFVCLGARILMGWLAGLLAAGLKKLPALEGGRSLIGYGAAGFAGAAMNTVFYLGGLWLLCAGVISQFYGIDLSGVGSFVMAAAVSLGLPEALVSCVVVAAVCKALEKVPALLHTPA